VNTLSATATSCTKKDALPLRVLCVDDNCDVADSEALLLQHVGFDVRVSYDGTTALEIAESFQPSICLLDLDMPGMDGVELAKRLHSWANGRPLVLVVITAMNQDICAERIREAPFDLSLVKPVDPHQLVAVIDTLWQKYSQPVQQ
jgi:two-component system, OmpR family, response regulator